jgi:threonine-phosphate decarboxylase
MKAPSSQLVIERAHGGDASAGGCVDFSASLNPLGPPPQAIRAYHEAAAKVSKYPPPYPRELEARLAAWLGVSPETVIAGNGSTQLIYLVARALNPRSPFVVIPTFSEVANGLFAAGSRPSGILTRAEDNFRLSHSALNDALEAGADAVFIGRPNSPTGVLASLDDTAAIAQACARRDAWCVIDEAFIEFADDPRSAASLLGSNPRLVVLRSLTKIFTIPGLRLGYLLASADFVRELRDIIEPWSVNTVAEHVAFACLDGAEDFIARTRSNIRDERRWLEQNLGRLPNLRTFPSSANFLMFAIPGEPARGEFGHHLRQRGIAIRDLSALPGCGPGMYRIGVRLRPDNERLVAAAADYFGAERR